ncbi:MAG: XTP/dITP diphosphatase [Armatimonadetes bacterium]|nr:XTP/dITP diphosphatase [Armatimonadota bacterium]
MRKLVVATKNLGKAREIAEMMADMPFEIVSLADYPDAPEVQESGATFTENAIIKATAYARFTGELVLADDSGLEVDALGGAPGVLSSRFAPTDSERNQRLLDLLHDVANDKRTARFRCVVAVAEPDGDTLTCEGSVEGLISREPKGENGFGYDPVFYVPELDKHFAELTPAQKNALSHRGRALEKAKAMLAAR